VVADREVLVERHDDRGIGQGALDVQQGLDAEIRVVVQVDDVGADLAQQRRELGREFRVGLAWIQWSKPAPE
jgi:hypothetical protein